ncbi:MAG TPA: carboxypeptidase regulatory-like domain-containing protein, partial [Candidatus Acidoferrum sp.]
MLLALSFVPAAFSQETTTGVQGYVKDSSGAVVANAGVEVKGPNLLGVTKTQTDSSGFYRFSALPVGTYSLTVTATGFRVVKVDGVSLEVGRLPNVDIQVEIGTATEVIEVHGEAPAVDVTQSKVAVTVGRDELSDIPIGRSFQSVIGFAPGARQEPLQSARGNRTNGFQIDGASDGENVYLIDGINTTNANVGGVGKNFQSDFIQEVQIKSSSFEAEYGGALGGVVNAVGKRGSTSWHGELKVYYQTSALDASDPCAGGFTSGLGTAAVPGSLVCGQRLDPAQASTNTSTRQDGTVQYFVPKKDDRTIVEPGYELGGAILPNRLFVFSSYIPDIDTTNRTTTFTGKNPGPRRLTNTFLQHNAYNRLDFRAVNSLNLFGSWNYAYSRTKGQLGSSDSAYGQVNTGSSTDPNTFRSDVGTVNPLSVYSFGGDWTPTSRTLVSARYGYFFSNNESRGVPSGTRYIYDTTVNAASTDLTGAPFPSSAFNTAGFSNIPNNFATLFDAYKRKSFNVDASYLVGHFLGSHTFKGGYFWSTQANAVNITANTNVVDLWWGTQYTPLTSTSACQAVEAQSGFCGGQFGYFTVGSNTVSNTGSTTQTAQAVYVQDAWTVGHGLTLNLGVRFDTESLPAYDPKRFPSLNFGWGQKVAPRIGGAYDLLHNGKVKVYASYGKFYDIMKMNLARGSFGSDYWHQCVYALDTTDYTTIMPTLASGAGCPASGPAPGVSDPNFRFIENVDFRATKADPRDPAIDTSMKPMSQHEFVTGVDWAITPSWSLESRYSRKRLDKAIEDMSITDNLGFYIGNPGSAFADVLHRDVVIPGSSGQFGPACTASGTPANCDPNFGSGGYLLSSTNGGPFCAECPGVVRATRRYDGGEFRLTHRGTKWYGSVSYTYSKLRGNYPGLTNSDPTDGNGGRHNPNNTRLFDLPNMTYLPNGKIDDGPLSTDRPNTVTAYGFYQLKWFHMSTNFGFVQSIFQGTPINTCLPVVGTSSACQWAEGRGNEVMFTRTPGDYQPDPSKPNFCTTCGDFVASKTIHDARTPAFLQTDFLITHEFGVSKAHENLRLRLEGNVTNLLNQHSAVAVNENVNASSGQLVSPVRGGELRFSGDPEVDWNAIMTPYNYVDALNGTGAFGTIVQVPCVPGSQGCTTGGTF